MDQKLALYQLAETGVVNPRNHTVVAQLLRKELVRRDPMFRVMNETFRRFVAREMSHEKAVEWEHEGVRLPWGSISTMMLTLALLPLGLLLLTQQQLLGTWAGMLPALTPVVPNVMKWIAAAPFGGSGERSRRRQPNRISLRSLRALRSKNDCRLNRRGRSGCLARSAQVWFSVAPTSAEAWFSPPLCGSKRTPAADHLFGCRGRPGRD